MNFKKIGMLIFILMHVFFLYSGQEEIDQERILKLEIGDKSLKGKLVSVYPGKIFAARAGKEIPFEKMIEDMQRCQFVYIGETHDSMLIHDIQARIIKSLQERNRSIAVGVEMFNVNLKEKLNKWSLGILTEEEFIREAQWYINWNFNFDYYSEILRFIKDEKIPLYPINAPREIITKIRKEGWEALSDEEKKIVPEPDLSNEDHRILMRATFENIDMPPQMKGMGLHMMFDGLYRAQVAWDEVMAANTVKAWKQENRKVVVLAGSGHLLYNLGINRIVSEEVGKESRTVICVEISKGEESVQVSRSLSDYIWGIPEEEKPVYPSFGLALKKINGLENLVLERKPISGVAVNYDFEKGDVILYVDGNSFNDINDLRLYLSRFSWGDEVNFRILRDGEEKEVQLLCIYTEDLKKDKLEE